MTTANDKDMGKKIALVMQHLSEGGTLKDLAKFTPEELEAVNAAASSYFLARKYDDAIELYRFLCTYDHFEQRWHYSLGVCLQSAGKYSEAVEAYASATVLNIEDPRPQAQAGYCLLALGDLDAAEAAFKGSIETCGDKPEHADIKKQSTELLASVQKQLADKKED